MNLYCLLLIIVYFCQDFQQNQAYNYCDNQDDDETAVCPKGSTHLICDLEQVPKLGDVVGVVPMTDKLKNLYLDLHNGYRNDIACGTLTTGGKNFSKATRMRKLIWDEELAFIAQIHAERCNMAHDKCRNKQKHRMCGQNLSWQRASKKNAVLDLCDLFVTGWFDEYKLITEVEGMAKLFPEAQFGEVGHFTGMVNDRISRVGCAMTLCKRPGEMTYHYHGTCNYDYTNALGASVYDDGDVGSKCSDWGTELSSDYECLCENSGELFKN